MVFKLVPILKLQHFGSMHHLFCSCNLKEPPPPPLPPLKKSWIQPCCLNLDLFGMAAKVMDWFFAFGVEVLLNEILFGIQQRWVYNLVHRYSFESGFRRNFSKNHVREFQSDSTSSRIIAFLSICRRTSTNGQLFLWSRRTVQTCTLILTSAQRSPLDNGNGN